MPGQQADACGQFVDSGGVRVHIGAFRARSCRPGARVAAFAVHHDFGSKAAAVDGVPGMRVNHRPSTRSSW
ncbi:hypothetical protein K2224_16625 [Streptomyces sp. BHT-5-2]|uniref:hypothetical protein n=1 Tax=unclassified Streptomyces TaxID=2593676 RepID=UPI001C8D4ECD|nr:hypothetical protein [Streptomyces sp. BHT-5-2]QZL04584.1 hypothetical protein K2224_16625 [Streptomyces sp. BHT-5-2]